MIGHLLIEGSSSAVGAGDESQKMGYAGRLFCHYMDYNRIAQARYASRQAAGADGGARESSPAYIYVRTNGAIDNQIFSFAPHFRNHIDEAYSVVMGYTGRMRTVGLFAIGGAIDSQADIYGRTEALQMWRRSFTDLQQTCDEYGVYPLFLGLPKHTPETRSFRGRLLDFDLYRQQCATTEEAIDKWGAPYVSFEEIVGMEREACIAPDGRHPNARGYERIATYFIPLIDKKLGIAAELHASPA